MARWLRNPVSEDGAAAIGHVMVHLGGPSLRRKVDRMAVDPVASRVLAERPDLSAYLSDLDALGRLPEGSFGRAYHDFMNRPEVLPASLLGALVHKGGVLERVEWDEDMLYVFLRSNVTHDLTHVLSGYGTDLLAEAINIGFIIGIEEMPAGRLLALAHATTSAILLRPSMGPWAWVRRVMEAYRRGAGAARVRPLAFLHFEELFPLPLEQVLREVGVVPVVGSVVTSEAMIGSRLGRRMANGYGQAGMSPERMAAMKELLAVGVPARSLVLADEATRDLLVSQVQAGASPDELLAAVAA
jgi:ubiquinone biosynthesis protein COQ4